MNSHEDSSPAGTDYRMTSRALDDSLAVVQAVFRRYRPVILARAGKSAHTDKSDGSPVTTTDIEVEETLRAELSSRFPSVPVYGEEAGYAEGHLTGTFWLVDPIDGTKSFVENVPTFTSMAVLIQDGEAAASVIYNPSTDAMYVARKGGGAYKNEQRLVLRNVPLPAIALCKETHFAVLNAILQPKAVTCQDAPSGGGNGFTLVADGRAAARFQLHSRGHTHDYAPGALLVREAGGVIIPIKEAVYTYETRSFVACHPALAALVRDNLPAIRRLER